MAKVIPIRRRGRLQGIRNLAGGTIAAGLACFYSATLAWFPTAVDSHVVFPR